MQLIRMHMLELCKETGKASRLEAREVSKRTQLARPAMCICHTCTCAHRVGPVAPQLIALRCATTGTPAELRCVGALWDVKVTFLWPRPPYTCRATALTAVVRVTAYVRAWRTCCIRVYVHGSLTRSPHVRSYQLGWYRLLVAVSRADRDKAAWMASWANPLLQVGGVLAGWLGWVGRRMVALTSSQHVAFTRRCTLPPMHTRVQTSVGSANATPARRPHTHGTHACRCGRPRMAPSPPTTRPEPSGLTTTHPCRPRCS